MKNLILLLMFFVLQTGTKKDYISIEFAGDGNKGVDVIYLSKEPIPLLEMIIYFEYSGPPFDYVISDQDFRFVKKEVLSSVKKPFENKDYHGFKVTVQENDSTVSYFIISKNANPFFNALITHFKAHKKYHDLTVLLSVHKEHIGY